MNSTFKDTVWATAKQSIGSWKVSNVTDMASLFEGSNYTDNNIKNWSHATDTARRLGKVQTVKGIALLFAGSFYPVVVMASALEDTIIII